MKYYIIRVLRLLEINSYIYLLFTVITRGYSLVIIHTNHFIGGIKV